LNGGAEHLLLALEAMVRQDAAAEKEHLTGEILGEEKCVAEAVEAAMAMALRRDRVEKSPPSNLPVATARRLHPAAVGLIKINVGSMHKRTLCDGDTPAAFNPCGDDFDSAECIPPWSRCM
jgi:hypothetical protein